MKFVLVLSKETENVSDTYSTNCDKLHFLSELFKRNTAQLLQRLLFLLLFFVFLRLWKSTTFYKTIHSQTKVIGTLEGPDGLEGRTKKVFKR